MHCCYSPLASVQLVAESIGCDRRWSCSKEVEMQSGRKRRLRSMVHSNFGRFVDVVKVQQCSYCSYRSYFDLVCWYPLLNLKADSTNNQMVVAKTMDSVVLHCGQ